MLDVVEAYVSRWQTKGQTAGYVGCGGCGRGICVKWKMKFNSTKSKVMVIRKREA